MKSKVEKNRSTRSTCPCRGEVKGKGDWKKITGAQLKYFRKVGSKEINPVFKY